MSGFEQLSALESGSGRRGNYADDPEFRQLQQELMGKLANLRKNISRLATEVNHLGTKRDTARVRERAHNLLDQSTELCKEIGDGIKKLQTWEDLTKQQKYDQQKVSTDFQAALQEFQTLQRKVLDKERASVTAARRAQTSEEGEESGEGQQEQLLQQQEVVRLADQSEVDFQESLIVEREAEIQNIEQGVSELNVLFRQVAQIVNEQGVQLNTIADNVDDTHGNVQGASVELRQAARYQKAARNKSCCLLLIMAIILTIVLLAIFID